jgi:gluconolactonase
MQLGTSTTASIYHEGPVYIEEINELFFVSNRIINESTDEQHINLYSMNLDTLNVRKLENHNILMANGAFSYDKDYIVVCSQGYGSVGASLVLLNYWNDDLPSVKPLLTDVDGRNFNSLNDVIVDSKGHLWFTDPPYGHEQGFRDAPELQPAVWFYDPSQITSRVPLPLIKGLDHPNGLALSPDEKILYVADSAVHIKSIYAFDISFNDDGIPMSSNKRLFASVDSGIPDGIKVHSNGDVYVGMGDGVMIWASDGEFKRKVQVPGELQVTNMVFVNNYLYMLCETEVHRVSIEE